MNRITTTLVAAAMLASGASKAQENTPGALIEKLERRIESLERQQSGVGGKEREMTFDAGGVVEVEAGYAQSYDGESASDIVLATVELAMGMQISEYVSGEVVLLYEDNGEEPLDVDTASFTIAGDSASLTAGQVYVPFGVFETNLVSDPLTLEIGETREAALQVDFGSAVALSAYAFRGDNRKDFGVDDDIDNFGLTAAFGAGQEEAGFAASVGYINDIGDSDGLQDGLSTNDVADRVAGLALAARYATGRMVIIAEYIGALDPFQASELAFVGAGAEPSAWNLEVGFPLALGGREVMFAFAVQGTEDALALELPERLVAAALSVGIREGVALSFEWTHDNDYDIADGGTGGSADTVTAQIVVEF